MMSELGGLLGWFGGVVAIAGSIIAGFSWVEGIASDEAKKAATTWLKRSKLKDLTWPEQFLTLFDRVFGQHPWTWKAFFRCALASLVMCLALTIVWYSLRPESVRAYVLYLQNCGKECRFEFLRFLPLTFLAFNLPADFLALVISRKVIGIALRIKTRLGWIAALVGATVACLSVYVAALAIFLVYVLSYLAAPALVEYLDQDPESVDPAGAVSLLVFLVNYFPSGFRFEYIQYDGLRVLPSAGVFIYTSIFTVGWMWLFLASGWLVRLLSLLDPGWQKLKWFLDIDAHPLRSLGLVAGGVSAAVFSLIKLAIQ